MKNIIYAGGTFDLFHWGHVRFLRNIKERFQKSHLIIAVNGDTFCREYKRIPVITADERLEIIRACKYVDEAFIMPKWSLQEYYIRRYHPNYIVIGSDWEQKDYLAQLGIDQNVLDAIDCKMLFMSYTKGISTTEIIHRILNLK